MNEQRANNSDVIEIDVLRILKALWKHVVPIIIVGVIAAGIGFSYAKFFVAPRYNAHVTMYVNNKVLDLGNTQLSTTSADLSAAKSLVNTYIVVLESRTTLEEVIRRADLSCSYEGLKNMVSAASVNGTEAFRVTVNSTDPQEAAKIANTIAEVLPDTIANVVEGTSVRVVDHATVPTRKASPSISKYAAIGLLAGLLLSCAVVGLRDIFDDVIHTEDDLTQRYDLPILAMIPDLLADSSEHYHYYKYGRYGRYSRYGRYGRKYGSYSQGYDQNEADGKKGE